MSEKNMIQANTEQVPPVCDHLIAGHGPRQQLVARIKRNSKYWGQTAPNAWFEVRVVEDNYYQLRGNSNNYRLCDVICGVRLASGAIVDLGKGKVLPAPCSVTDQPKAAAPPQRRQ